LFLLLKRNLKRITFDLGASLIESYKKSAKRTYKGFRGYDPLLMVIAEYNLVYMGIFRGGTLLPRVWGEFMGKASEWLRYYNVRRKHFGRGMDRITPLEKLKRLIPWMSASVALFPVVLLEKVSNAIPRIQLQKVGTMSRHITVKIFHILVWVYTFFKAVKK